MLEDEKFIDDILMECVRLTTFDIRSLHAKFSDTAIMDEANYRRQMNISRALNFLEHMHLLTHRTEIRVEPNLSVPMEIQHGFATRSGRIVVHAPKALRLSLLWTLLRWKKTASILGALAAVKLLHNAYLGAAVLMGWIEYAAFTALVWIIYLLIRRALK